MAIVPTARLCVAAGAVVALAGCVGERRSEMKDVRLSVTLSDVAYDIGPETVEVVGSTYVQGVIRVDEIIMGVSLGTIAAPTEYLGPRSVTFSVNDGWTGSAVSSPFLVEVVDLSVSPSGAITTTIGRLSDPIIVEAQPSFSLDFDRVSLTSRCEEVSSDVGCGGTFDAHPPSTESLRTTFAANECSRGLLDSVVASGTPVQIEGRSVELGPGGLVVTCRSNNTRYNCEGRFEHKDAAGCLWEGVVITTPDLSTFALSAKAVSGCDRAVSEDPNAAYCRTGVTEIWPVLER